MTPDSALTFRELTASPEDRARVRLFHDDLYGPEFPDPDEKESLANIERYLQLKAAGWYGANNYHVLLAESAGAIVAGAIIDYLAGPNTGVIEFLVVAPEARGAGLGHRLLERVESLIADDARAAGHREPDWIVAEINDPFCIDVAADNLDPFVRAVIWGRWGFAKLDFPYVQPALSDAQQPVRHLMLAAKRAGAVDREVMPAETVVEILRGYVTWAMRIPDPDANVEFRRMRDHLGTVSRVPLVGLERYVGRDPATPVHVDEVRREGADLDAVVRIYGQAFSRGATALDSAAFRDALHRRWSAAPSGMHHLWAIRPGPQAPVAGMASFFSLAGAGFGGYVALGAALRGRGRLRTIVARMEEQMCRDRTGARGWLIECEPGSEALRTFERVGFREIAIEYRQPPLGEPADRAMAPRLALAYKALGASRAIPSLTRASLRTALVEIFRVVYGVAAAEKHPLFLVLEAQMNAWPTDAVEWRPVTGQPRAPSRPSA